MRATTSLVLIASFAVLTACAPAKPAEFRNSRGRRAGAGRGGARPRDTKPAAQGARRRRQAPRRLGRSGRGQERDATDFVARVHRSELARQDRPGSHHARSGRGQMALPHSRSSRAARAGISTARQAPKRSSTAASARTSSIPSSRAWRTSMRSGSTTMRNPQNDPMLHYANRLISTDGKKDGLYWPAAENEEQSPLGEGFAQARAEGYLPQGGTMKGVPFHGYIYRAAHAAGTERSGWRVRLPGQRSVVRRIRRGRLPGRVRQFRRHDLHGESRWRGLFDRISGPDTAKLALAIDTFDPALAVEAVRKASRRPRLNSRRSCRRSAAQDSAAALRAPCASA